MAIKLNQLGRSLRWPWYQLWRSVERLLYQGREYTLQVPFGHRIYTPWFLTDGESPFAEIMAKVRAGGPVVVSLDRCHLLYQLSQWAIHVPGAFAECGVFSGSTAQLLALVLASEDGPERRDLHLFDTFAGMPGLADPARDYHGPGDFSDTSPERVRSRVDYQGCQIHAGAMPGTFEEVAHVQPYAFVHVDVDIYESAIECCRWFWPRMAMGGIMVFDDYGFYPYRRAARAAVDSYFRDQPIDPVVLPTAQALATQISVTEKALRSRFVRKVYATHNDSRAVRQAVAACLRHLEGGG